MSLSTKRSKISRAHPGRRPVGGLSRRLNESALGIAYRPIHRRRNLPFLAAARLGKRQETGAPTTHVVLVCSRATNSTKELFNVSRPPSVVLSVSQVHCPPFLADVRGATDLSVRACGGRRMAASRVCSQAGECPRDWSARRQNGHQSWSTTGSSPACPCGGSARFRGVSISEVLRYA
jgi:hypothetical protein